MKPIVRKLWLNYIEENGTLELRLDWSNDRHHGIRIEKPFTKKEVVSALNTASRLISVDKELD